MILLLVPGTMQILSQDDVSNVLSFIDNPNSNHKTKKKTLIWKKGAHILSVLVMPKWKGQLF